MLSHDTFIRTRANILTIEALCFQAKLTKKFSVQAIPTLVFLEGRTGKLITTDGRNNILDDPQGAFKANRLVPRVCRTSETGVGTPGDFDFLLQPTLCVCVCACVCFSSS